MAANIVHVVIAVAALGLCACGEPLNQSLTTSGAANATHLAGASDVNNTVLSNDTEGISHNVSEQIAHSDSDKQTEGKDKQDNRWLIWLIPPIAGCLLTCGFCVYMLRSTNRRRGDVTSTPAENADPPPEEASRKEPKRRASNKSNPPPAAEESNAAAGALQMPSREQQQDGLNAAGSRGWETAGSSSFQAPPAEPSRESAATEPLLSRQEASMSAGGRDDGTNPSFRPPAPGSLSELDMGAGYIDPEDAADYEHNEGDMALGNVGGDNHNNLINMMDMEDHGAGDTFDEEPQGGDNNNVNMMDFEDHHPDDSFQEEMQGDSFAGSPVRAESCSSPGIPRHNGRGLLNARESYQQGPVQRRYHTPPPLFPSQAPSFPSRPPSIDQSMGGASDRQRSVGSSEPANPEMEPLLRRPMSQDDAARFRRANPHLAAWSSGGILGPQPGQCGGSFSPPAVYSASAVGSHGPPANVYVASMTRSSLDGSATSVPSWSPPATQASGQLAFYSGNPGSGLGGSTASVPSWSPPPTQTSVQFAYHSASQGLYVQQPSAASISQGPVGRPLSASQRSVPAANLYSTSGAVDSSFR